MALGGLLLADKMADSIKMIRYESDRFLLDECEVDDAERPPMAAIRLFRQARAMGLVC